MPEISRFFGIIIAVFYNDHSPAHFHVRYNNFKASISIDSFQLIEGDLPKRVLSMVLEWAFEHRNELMDDWNLAQQKMPLKPIKPLE